MTNPHPRTLVALIPPDTPFRNRCIHDALLCACMQCWCQGSDINLRHGLGTCDYDCTGDDSMKCGGFDSFLLYELDEMDPSASPTNGHDNYVGCFADAKNDRVLDSKTSSGGMTTEVNIDLRFVDGRRNVRYRRRQCYTAVRTTVNVQFDLSIPVKCREPGSATHVPWCIWPSVCPVVQQTDPTNANSFLHKVYRVDRRHTLTG